jgi:hypothetical protein
MVDNGTGRNEDGRRREVSWVVRTEPDDSSEHKDKPRKARWKPRSRQEEGRKTEKAIAKNLGARLHPNSGALRIKHDASDEETLYEIKDANKTYTLSADELFTLWTRAVRESKEPVFIVHYIHHNITATITLSKGTSNA